MIKRMLLSLLIIAHISGCAVFKIEATDLDSKSLANLEKETSSIERVNSDFPEGMHCFEPMMFFLTLGIVPIHCINRYELSIEEKNGHKKTHEVKVTSMNGWIPLLLIPSSTWNYGKYDGSVEGLMDAAN